MATSEQAANTRQPILPIHSNVAFRVSNRFLDGANQGSVSMDTTMQWSRKVNFTGQLIRSHGPVKEGVWAFYERPSWDTNTGHFHLRFTHMGEIFADNANATGSSRTTTGGRPIRTPPRPAGFRRERSRAFSSAR
jgi:hypothetical protein